MELAGLVTTQPISREILNDQRSGAIALDNVPSYCVFKPMQVELDHEYGTNRPSLRIGGFVSRVSPRAEMPYDVRFINFDAENAPFMTVDYVFDNEQLKQLVDKGLFEKGFTPPRNKLQDVELEFIADIDMMVVPPVDEAHPPLIVVDPRGMDLVLLDDDYRTQYPEDVYDFAAEFDDFTPVANAEASKFVDIDTTLDLGELETQAYVDRQDLVEEGSLSVVQRLHELAGGELRLTAYDVLSVIEPNEKQLSELVALHKARGAEQTSVIETPAVETDELEIIDFGDDDEFELDDEQAVVENTQADAEVEAETEEAEADAEDVEAQDAEVETERDTDVDAETDTVTEHDEHTVTHNSAKAKKKSDTQRKLENIYRQVQEQAQQMTPDTGLSL